MDGWPMRKIISIALTLSFIIGVGIAMYQSAVKQKPSQEKPIIATPEPIAPVSLPPAVPQLTPQKIVQEKAPPIEIIPLKGFFEEKLSDNTTLHAIGVYQGENESGKEDPPWWSKCKDLHDEKAALECHRQYAGLKTKKTVTVHIGYSKTPVVIALMAYDPVAWRLNFVQGVNVEGIILAGYEEQELIGVPANIKVVSYTYKTPKCEDCARGEGYFYAYKQGPELQKAAQKLLEITGKQLASFQGSYQASRFKIFNNID